MKKFLLLLVSLLILLCFSCASDKTENSTKTDSPSVSKNQDQAKDKGSFKEPEDFEEPLVRDLDSYENEKTTTRKPREKKSKKNQNGTSLKTDTSESTTSKTNDTKTKDEAKTSEDTAQAKTENKATTEKTATTSQAANGASSSTAKPNNTNNLTKAPAATKPVTAPSAPKTTTPANTAKAPNTTKPQNNASQNKNAQNSANSNNKNINKDFFVIPQEEKQDELKNIPVSSDTKPVPSRRVTMKKNETLNITYPGSGWVYLGSTSEYNNLSSTNKKTINDETTFSLVSKAAGTQVHHFYKLDNLTGKFIDDYIEIEVTEESGSLYSVVKAPEYKFIVPEQPAKPALSTKNYEKLYSTENPETEEKVQNTPSAPSLNDIPKNNLTQAEPTEEGRNFINYEGEEYTPTVTEEEVRPPIDLNPYTETYDASELLTQAQKLFDEKKYEEANLCIKAFFEKSTEKRDQGLYLQGQILEQDSPVKDIKGSINSYQNLIDNYPESKYYEQANKRIIYLKRFYIEIR